MTIKPCPCGKTPAEIAVYDLNQGGKWAAAVPDCCGEWMIEFRTNYLNAESDECKQLALDAWNDAPRNPALKAEMYDYIRTLNPRQFTDLWTRNVSGEGAFDELLLKMMGKK